MDELFNEMQEKGLIKFAQGLGNTILLGICGIEETDKNHAPNFEVGNMPDMDDKMIDRRN